jgi:Raf kinase inhibitor-like YbhB/YbcL family protein
VAIDGSVLEKVLIEAKCNNILKKRRYEMKRKAVLFVFLAVLVFLFSALAFSADAEAGMTVSSGGIQDGKLGRQYGKFGSQSSSGVPTLSLPLVVEGAPEGTVCYAVEMRDRDVPWTHWLATNIETPDLPENASAKGAAGMVQGKNDFGKVGYGGPTPPDRPHTYEITVYALNAKIKLSKGFTKRQFDAALKDTVLAKASIKGKYNN